MNRSVYVVVLLCISSFAMNVASAQDVRVEGYEYVELDGKPVGLRDLTIVEIDREYGKNSSMELIDGSATDYALPFGAEFDGDADSATRLRGLLHRSILRNWQSHRERTLQGIGKQVHTHLVREFASRQKQQLANMKAVSKISDLDERLPALERRELASEKKLVQRLVEILPPEQFSVWVVNISRYPPVNFFTHPLMVEFLELSEDQIERLDPIIKRSAMAARSQAALPQKYEDPQKIKREYERLRSLRVELGVKQHGVLEARQLKKYWVARSRMGRAQTIQEVLGELPTNVRTLYQEHTPFFETD